MEPRAVVDNAADPRQVKQGKKTEEQIRRQNLEDVKKVASTPEGKRLIWRLLELCNMFSSVVGPSPEDTYFNEGARVIGLTLLNDLRETLPEALVEMLITNKKKLEAQRVLEEERAKNIEKEEEEEF